MTRSPAEQPELGPALLFCPADRPERFAKAAERADGVILDLEDAVAAQNRIAAREHVAAYLASTGEDHTDQHSETQRVSRTIVRINPVTSVDYDADLRMLATTKVRWVMLAKAESADDVASVASSLPGVGVLALCETPAGVTAAADIAAHPSTVGLMWGAEDLVAALGGTGSRTASGSYIDVARLARAQVLLAAGTHSKTAIDAIYADFNDQEGLSAEAKDAVASGWSAKACIHPAQVPVIRSAYSPSPEQLEYAQALLAEMDNREGVFQFRGAMVDGPLIRHAEQTLRRANAVQDSPGG